MHVPPHILLSYDMLDTLECNKQINLLKYMSPALLRHTVKAGPVDSWTRGLMDSWTRGRLDSYADPWCV